MNRQTNCMEQKTQKEVQEHLKILYMIRLAFQILQNRVTFQ